MGQGEIGMRIVLVLILAGFLLGCNKPAETPKNTSQPKVEDAPAKPITPPKPLDSASTSLDTDSKILTPPPDAPTPKRQPGTSASPIKNKRWKLLSLNGETISVTDQFKGEPYITLGLHSDKITGNGGCNRFGGKYSLNGNKISFSGFAATKMMCEDAMKVETSFLKGLEAIDGFQMDGEDHMWLTSHGKRTMRFEAVYLN